MYDPVHLGIDEYGYGVDLELIYRNILLAGEPGAGKSVALNNIVAHGALATDCSMWLFDGKQVELGLWTDVADVFVAALGHPRAVRATFEVVWGDGPPRDSLPALLDRLKPDAQR